MNPNEEQKLAIEHSGGVLLKAGAGSGKTFVLVEHIIYLVKLEIEKSKGDLDSFRINLRLMLKEIVLMTFTNKAANEIKIRLKKRVDSHDKDPYWTIISEEIDILKTTTIHGFFYSLIKEGNSSTLPPNLNIVDTEQIAAKIEDIFNRWLAKTPSHLGLIKIISLRKEVFVKSFVKIFMDPELRLTWKNSKTLAYSKIFDQAVLDLVNLLDINELFIPVDMSEYESQKKNLWYKFVVSFQENNFQEIKNLKDLIKMFNFLDSLEKNPTRPARKNNFESADIFFDAFTNLKELYKDLSESINMMTSGDSDLVKEWFDLFLEVFEFISDNYFNNYQISFSDIEYLVKEATNDKSFIKMVSSRYKYFIIDEFQDTSQIQYDILTALAENDYKRFFCIGDIKQAIYGFRGGEIGVFIEMQNKIPTVFTMSNNYRSARSVTEFNNHFFFNVLNMGIGFEGEDIHLVEFENQNAPSEKSIGKVEELHLKIDWTQDERVNNHHLDNLEAFAILEKIKTINLKSENVAVLYKKLKPSKILIKELIKADMSFTAQIKLPLKSDPILGLFKVFISYLVKKENDPYFNFMINSYLQLLNKKSLEQIEWLKWANLKNFFPLNHIFTMFLNELELSTSSYKESLESIEKLIINNDEDIDAIYTKIENLKDENYSMHFKYGPNPDQIKIMSTHASKGLEFEHVFIGGIYTNGRAFPNTDIIGNQPGSFKFHHEESSRKSYKTPSFLLENKINQLKDFSESKRLLYVACTRAEEGLYWVNLDIPGQKLSINQNSWINAFLNIHAELKQSVYTITCDNNTDTIGNEIETPLFHHIDFGITQNEKKSISVLSELSVTRLTTAIKCPRMFYFENILKIKSFEIDYLKSEVSNTYDFTSIDKEDFTEAIRSNANRGTNVHSILEHIIKHNFTLPREIILPTENIHWALDYLKSFSQDYEFLSEETVKFKLNDYMVSGIPDLILKNKTDKINQIIDFKTGKIKLDQNDHYWTQLYCYAYYLFKEDPTQKEISLKLMYIDEREILEKVVSFDQVQKEIDILFNLIDKPNQINQLSCDYCSYGNICHRP